jgi:hypothetical protein
MRMREETYCWMSLIELSVFKMKFDEGMSEAEVVEQESCGCV